MTDERFEKFGPILAQIGGASAEIAGGEPDGLYLYVEVGDRWISVSVFKDEGAAVRCYGPTSELSDLIYDFWKAEEPAKRWAIMEYEIKGTKFDAQFLFPEEVDVESFETDRREIALKNRFGAKPVIYPPRPGAEEAPR